MILWTLIVTSTILMISMHNIIIGEENPLNIEIPSELLLAMGISLVSLVATPPLLAIKTLSEASASAVKQAAERTNDFIPDIKPVGEIFGRTLSSKASWKDMLCGDEIGNAGVIDLSKVQQLFITVIIIAIYSIEILMNFYKTNEHIDFPGINKNFVFLLLISHASYLGFKAVNKGQGSASPAAALAPAENSSSVNPATSSAVG
jgi:hypothetical protein